MGFCKFPSETCKQELIHCGKKFSSMYVEVIERSVYAFFPLVDCTAIPSEKKWLPPLRWESQTRLNGLV